MAATGNGLRWRIDRFTDDGSHLYPLEFVNYESGKLTAKTILNYSIGPGHINRTGITINRLGYNQLIKKSHSPETGLHTIVDVKGNGYLYQGFSQSRFDFDKMTVIAGLYVQHFGITNTLSVEPRIGFQFRQNRNLYSLSYGRHAQTEPLSIYFSHPENLKLDQTKADHIVAGFSRSISHNLQLKLEAYYQNLTDVPVIENSSFSVLNMELDWFLNDRLINSGRGRNYGLELTLERYFADGWHGLVTGSLFQSKYKDGMGKWRDTRFNRGYTFVALGGKEWEFRKPHLVRVFGINGRVNYMGGKRYTPVDLERSREAGDVLYFEDRAFSLNEPEVFYSDLTLELRTNRRSISTVWSIQIINLTGYKEFYGYRYNLRENRVDEEREMILIPNISYKIEF